MRCRLTARGPEVITAVAPDDTLGPTVFAELDARGALRGEPRLPLASMILRSLDVARVVATRRGALVFIGLSRLFGAGGIMATPIDRLP